MMILALDTTMAAVSACVFDTRTGRAIAAETMGMERGHAEALMPAVERVVSRCEGGFEAFGRIAVAVGPGSFTGIRICIAAARAFGLACGAPVVGVSTLAALAAPLIVEEVPGQIAAAIDARHGAVYIQAFSADGRTVLTPRILTLADAVRALGPGPLRVAGSGAPALVLAAWAQGVTAEVVGEIVAPEIVYVARLGALADPAQSPARPLYLKAPDARPSARGAIERAREPQGTL